MPILSIYLSIYVHFISNNSNPELQKKNGSEPFLFSQEKKWLHAPASKYAIPPCMAVYCCFDDSGELFLFIQEGILRLRLRMTGVTFF